MWLGVLTLLIQVYTGWEWVQQWAVTSPVCTTGVYRCVNGSEWVHQWAVMSPVCTPTQTSPVWCYVGYWWWQIGSTQRGAGCSLGVYVWTASAADKHRVSILISNRFVRIIQQMMYIRTQTQPFVRDYPGELVTEGKTNLDFTGAWDSEWLWHQLGQMQAAPRSRQITTPASHHSVFYRPDAIPATLPTASKHWRQNRWWCILTVIKIGLNFWWK